MKHRVRGLALAVAATIGLTTAVVVPSAAWASDASCHFYYTDWGCLTGPVSANANHKIYARLTSYSSGSVDCYVRDNTNGVAVSHLWITSQGAQTWQVIPGLYATYTMRCTQPWATAGSGEAFLSNETWRTG